MKRLLWIALLLVWGQLFLHLSLEWSYNQQYSYGWLVPLLGGYLIYIRWKERPALSKPFSPAFTKLLVVAALLTILPLRVLEEANPDWRLLSWVHATFALVITLCLANLAGGRRWIGWFAWAFAFLLVAVPWPTSIENAVVQGLMRMVSVGTAELANWIGIPAIPRGNLIDLPSGTLGVSEACSGVRSIQASVMCCAFFSLLYGIKLNRAWALWLIGVGSAVVFNIGRTLFLTITAANRGLHSVELFHDPAGHLLVVVIFGVCWLAARWLSGNVVPPIEAPSDAFSATVGFRLPIVICTWVLIVAGASELWYRSAPRADTLAPPWELRLPVEAGTPRSIPAAARAILRCDRSSTSNFQVPDGSRWSIFYLTWDPGSAVAQLARSHSPEICLPAAGIALKQRAAPFDLLLGEGRGTLHFDRYIFEDRGRSLFVFFSVWEPGSETTGEFDPAAMYDRGNRVQAALERRRLLGQRVIEIAVEGLPTLEAATASVQEYLPLWLPPK